MQSSRAEAVPKALHVSSEDVEGVTVYDAVGKKIGDVDHLIIEKTTGKVLGVVVNVKRFHRARSQPPRVFMERAPLRP